MPLTDEAVPLDWLATPWSTIRYLSGQGRGRSDAEVEGEVRLMLRDLRR